jgi:acyl-CoA dehydrogenase
VLVQRRLGGGRIHHAMPTIARCEPAFDMMCERALSRRSHRTIIGEHQMVQEKIADSYAAIRRLVCSCWRRVEDRQHLDPDARTDIAAVKHTTVSPGAGVAPRDWTLIHLEAPDRVNDLIGRFIAGLG